MAFWKVQLTRFLRKLHPVICNTHHGHDIIVSRSTNVKQCHFGSRHIFTCNHRIHSKLRTNTNVGPKICSVKLSQFTPTSDLETSIFSKNLSDCKTQNDVLHLLGTQSSESLLGADVHLAVKQLTDAFYTTLDHIPWLQRNRDIAFIQLLLSKQLGPRTEHLWTHEGLGVITEWIQSNCEHMTTTQLTETLLNLSYMGLNVTPAKEDVLIRLLFLCQDRIPDADIYELFNLTTLHFRMYMHDWRSIKLELQRFSQFMSDPHLDLTPDKALCVARILLNSLGQPITNPAHHVIEPQRRLLARLEEGGCLEEADHISTYLRLSRSLFMYAQGDQHMARRLISLASQAAVKKIHTFNHHNIAEASAALRQSRCFTKELIAVFSARSCELLNEDCKLCEVCNLFYAISRHTRSEIKMRFESAIFRRMQEVDVVLISNLAENFVASNVTNEDLIRLLHSHIADQAQGLAAYSTRFNKVVRLLLRKPFIDSEHESKFTHSVLAEFDRQTKVSNVAMFCVYILPASRTALDEDIYQRILSIIPKLRSYDHHRMALAINQIRNPTAQLRRQAATLQSVLHEWIINKSEEIRNLDYLFQLTLEMAVNNRKPDPTITTHFMEMFPKFTKSLTDVSMSKVHHVFIELAYYLPEVYDDLTAFALDTDVHRDQLLVLIFALSRVGYTPKRFNELVERALRLFDELGENKLFRDQIVMMRNLNILNVYPEEQLARIFSLDYIEALDNYIERNPRRRTEVESVMMTLNRNVVLECPQLDIPWFHEQYMTNTLKPETDRMSFSTKFKDEVEKVLLDPELLDRGEYLRRWVHTPYGFPINFEFILDESKNPVPLEDYDDKALPSTMQRFAVLTTTEKSYTYNQRRLLGLELQRWRQLEILGYKVIDIPYFEWYSMGLSDYIAKVEYLSAKIFDS